MSGFLERWSRRKRAAAETPEPAEAPDATEVAAEPAPLPEPPPEAEPEADPDLLASLPPVETITATTDIRGFLQPGVPQALRNAALRAAWTADPVIRDYRDPAVDYFWDWNAPGGVPGGGGDLVAERVAEMARAVMDGPRPPELPAADSQPSDPKGETAADPAPAPLSANAEANPAPAESASAVPVAAQEVATDAPPRRRHGGAVPG